ncbi:MAG: Lipopolysaccharide export system permease protein LptF [Syntrophus sp. PtaU1.Bin208]|nr:MAG: Lipopolysaccharide export system permease protein LptF [Syntrophus sp. PtaU1.Bin208]
MILDRYITREIVRPTAIICTTLAGVFGCYMAARYLEDSVQGQLPGSMVILLILLRIAIALEVLLPTTLYLSVMIAFGRLYRDSEITGMFAGGLSMARLLRPVICVAITAGLIVACFSLYIRPWAWNQFYALKAQAKANFDMTRMKGGNFYEIEDGRTIIFAETVDSGAQQARQVFMQINRPGKMQIIYSQAASQHSQDGAPNPVLLLHSGYLYEFTETEKTSEILQFGILAVPLTAGEKISPEQKVKALQTERLLSSRDREEIAELQWRLVAPVSTALLALLGVPLSRSSPRQGKFAKVPLGILVFAVYYNLSAMTKKWVEQGIVGSFPGIWWVQALLAGLLLILLWRPSLPVRRRIC